MARERFASCLPETKKITRVRQYVRLYWHPDCLVLPGTAGSLWGGSRTRFCGVQAACIEYAEVESEMKYCLAVMFLILLCMGRSGAATPTFADNHVSGSSTQGNGVSRYDFRLPNGTMSGNCIVVGFQYSAGSAGVTASVSDDRGNTYSSPTSNSDGRQVVNLAFSLNVAAGTQKISITFSGGTPAFVTGMASEFYNVAPSNALDGSSGSNGTGSSVTSGSLTPANSGDLIYQYAVQDSAPGSMVSWTQGGSPWSLLSADVLDGTVAQYQVQASAAPINPSLTMAPSQNFNSVAIALRSATAGNAPPAGIRAVRVQHNSIPANAGSPVTLQFPCTGNLIVVAWIGVPGHDLTGITDGNSNSYTSAGPAFGFGLSGDNQIYYAATATTSTAMTGPNLSTTGSDISGSTAVLFDVRGAATSPFDAIAGRATASGVQNSAGNVTAATISPSTANGLVISTLGVDSNTINGVSPGNFLSAVPTPVASPNPVDQNNGWALWYNSSPGSGTFVWTSQGGQVDDWSSIAAAFEAPNGSGSSGSFSGTVSPTSATIKVGDFQVFTVQISSVNNFQGQVSLSCPNTPAGISCQFTSTPVQLNPNATATSSLTVSVTGKSASVFPSWRRLDPKFTARHMALLAIAEFVAILFVFPLGRNCWRQRLRIRLADVAPVTLLFVLVLSLESCSGGGSGTGTGGGGAPVIVQVSVQGASGSTTVNMGTVAITIP